MVSLFGEEAPWQALCCCEEQWNICRGQGTETERSTWPPRWPCPLPLSGSPCKYHLSLRGDSSPLQAHSKRPAAQCPCPQKTEVDSDRHGELMENFTKIKNYLKTIWPEELRWHFNSLDGSKHMNTGLLRAGLVTSNSKNSQTSWNGFSQTGEQGEMETDFAIKSSRTRSMKKRQNIRSVRTNDETLSFSKLRNKHKTSFIILVGVFALPSLLWLSSDWFWCSHDLLYGLITNLVCENEEKDTFQLIFMKISAY